MPPIIATFVFFIGILGLFMLERDKNVRTSKALWIPVIWLLLAGSRAVSQWMQTGPIVDSLDQYLDGSPLDRAVLSSLMAAGLVVLLTRVQRVGAILRANAPVLLFFSYCAFSTLWSDYPDVAFKRWFKASGDLMMILIVLTERDWLAAFKRLLSRVGFLLIPLSVLFIRYYPDLGRGYSRFEGTAFYTGVATDKNMLGIICLVLGLGSTWRFLHALWGEADNRGRQLIAHGTIVAMVGWLLWMSNSVTSTVCFLLVAVSMALTKMRMLAGKTWVVHLMLAAMVSTCLFALFFDAGGGLVATIGRDPTLTGRTAIWDVVLEVKGNPFFGTGFESFWLGERIDQIWSFDGGFFRGIQEAHNGYLEVYLNLGWVGIALLALVMVAGYRTVLAALRHNPDVGRLRLAYFAIALIYNLTEAAFRMRSPVWIFFLLASISVPEPSTQEDLALSTEVPSLEDSADLSLARANASQEIV